MAQQVVRINDSGSPADLKAWEFTAGAGKLVAEGDTHGKRTKWIIPVRGLYRGEAGSRNNDIKRNIDPDSIVRVDFGFGPKRVRGRVVKVSVPADAAKAPRTSTCTIRSGNATSESRRAGSIRTRSRRKRWPPWNR